MKCVKCSVQVEKIEIFPGQICVSCYAQEFEKEFQSAIKVGRFE